MKRWTIALIGILAMTGMAQAVIIDHFDYLGPTSSYTSTVPAHQPQLNRAAVGWSGLAPVAGAGLGTVPQDKQTYCMMTSAVTFNMGDTLDVWVEPGNYGGGGVAVKFNDGTTDGYYVVALGNQGDNHALIVKTFDGQSSGGSPIAYTTAGQIAGHSAMYQGAGSIADGEWYHMIVSINTVGTDVVLDATVNSGTPGDEALVASTQYVDVGWAGTTTLSNIGLAVSEWNNMGPDFDEFGFVPEPASLALLGLGGAAVLLRKRR
ncbi:MAG TPA: PEP-CTERM sorting domain-containing protein [Phycisphaerae bacterium]|nr:PEP-CTERM sorting domain-containing protein [Phycisphaerae bacterium]